LVTTSIAKSTVFNVLKHYRENGDVVFKGKSPGRPRLVSSRNQRSLIKLCKKGRRNTLRDITAQWNEESGLKLSRECCRQWIHKSGLKFYKVRHKDFVHFQFKSNFYNMKAKEKPLLTKKQKKNRYEWAKSKLSWTVDDWAKIIFSDESKFDVCVGDFRKRVIRSKDEAFHADCIKRTVKFPKGVMIWGCMSAKGLGNFEFIDGTVKR
jgi:hypothetical protein